jgi:hypothetical protein
LLKVLTIVGLKLLEIIRELKGNNKDPDLKVQLDVFEEQRDSDETQSAGSALIAILYSI